MEDICRIRHGKISVCFGFIFLILQVGAIGTALAAEVASTVVAVSGQVEKETQNSSNWLPAEVEDQLIEGDQIQTWEGKSTLLLSDESMLKLNRNTRLRMKLVSQSASWNRVKGLLRAAPQVLKSNYQLNSGEAWIRNNNKDVDINIETPTVTASLRGTELNIEVVSAELVNITVLEGKALAANNFGSIEAVQGEVIIAALGQPPRKQTLLTPEDSVQWTVRIPNLFTPQDWLQQNLPSAQQAGADAILQSLSIENTESARQRFQQLNLASDDKLNNLGALISLQEGDISAAAQEFSRLSSVDANDGIAWRGLSIASLLLNNKPAAIDAAEQAVRLSSSSNPLSGAVDWLMLGYAQRASFDLEQAETSLQRSLENDPNNVITASNLALLQFSDGRLQQAQETVDSALSIDAKDSLANSMAGFISLTRREHGASEQQFRDALKFDPSNSEAYLGLGLLAMRNGDTQSAQKQISTAIALEPQRSLYLSYWAKILHEVGRYDKAITVLNTASRLDPRDPTPHFYKSVVERDLFLAGEAIESIQTAIELNDNRAVYRSRLLLDQDLASRNINLATTYGALGLGLIANQKAIESTIDDYRNFSAHLFLSSALSGSGRDFPAGSEVLVTGLLLPANANSLSSINDYTTFFEGPEFDSNVGVSVGNQGTYAGSLSFAGVAPDQNLSYNFLASTGSSDGWRDDRGLENSSASATINWQASEVDNIRARVSYNDSEQMGNTFARFEVDQARNADALLETEDMIFDLGYRRQLSNKSDLLLNLLYRDTEFIFSDTVLAPFDLGVNFQTDERTDSERETVQLQAQYSSRSDNQQLFIGGVVFDGDQLSDFTQRSDLTDLSGNILPVIPEIRAVLDDSDALINQISDTQQDTEFASLYIDNTWFIANNLSVQGALYFEDFDNGTTDVSELNPRLGAVWSPTSQDTIRLAGFRYILPLVQSRLHPTHVGGVFITRNTEEGALVEEVNLVWERSWKNGLFSVNVFDLERENRERLDPSQAETVLRSGLRGVSFGINQMINKRLGFSAGVGLSELEDDFVLLQSSRDEVNAIASLSYVSPSGFSAGISQTFRDIDFTNSARSNESISITDISMAYTFNRRRATIALTVSNLFDQEFNWVTDAFSIGGRSPARLILANASWNF